MVLDEKSQRNEASYPLTTSPRNSYQGAG